MLRLVSKPLIDNGQMGWARRGSSAGSRCALHVVTRFRQGGSEKRVRDIVAALPELDHHVLVGSDSDLALARAFLPAAHVDMLETLHRPVSPRADLLTLGRLSVLLRGGRFSVVFSHQSKAGALVRAASLLAPRVVVVHSLSMASFGPGYGRLEGAAFRRLERWLGSHTDRYLVVGEDLAHRYTGLGIDPSRFRIVRSGARLPEPAASPSESRAELGIPPNRAVLVYLGSLEPRKGVSQLPDLLARVARHLGGLDRVFLLIAGDGPEATRLESDFRHRGMTNSVRLMGHVDDITPLLWAADAMVLLSRAEGLPQALLQAAATGLPFVSFAVDGVDELLALGAVGASVPLGSLDAAAQATVRLLERGRGEPAIDLTPWSPDVILAGHRSALAEIAPGLVSQGAAR